MTEQEEMYKALAKLMLNKIEETRPNKDKTAKEQANKEQKKAIEYFEKVAETGRP